MSYQTLLNQACGWVFSDVERALWIAIAIAVIGAANGILRSFNRCKGPYNGRIL